MPRKANTAPARSKAENTSPDKLSVVVFSGDFEKVHYALAIASAAAAIGRSATLFFTMEGAVALLAPGSDGVASWRRMPAKAGTAGRADDALQRQGVAHFEELLAACVELEVTFMVCEMGLRALGLEGAALRPDVPITAGGIVTFLNDASRTGAVVFV
ncbi:MAG: hypothetical protein EXQ90_02635 [Rhodospirillales bacterium]|nr:hypothetical protein [Rhodospirillales bacterium]